MIRKTKTDMHNYNVSGIHKFDLIPNVHFYGIKNIPIQKGVRVCFHQSQSGALSLQQRPVNPLLEKKMKTLNGPQFFFLLYFLKLHTCTFIYIS